MVSKWRCKRKESIVRAKTGVRCGLSSGRQHVMRKVGPERQGRKERPREAGAGSAALISRHAFKILHE